MHVKKQITNLTIKNMKKITFLFTLLFFAISTFAADYYVAGTPSLCGSNWSNNDAANKMELVDGIYKKVYSNVPAGSHEFKITNGTWNNSKGAGNVDASTSTPGYTGSDNISFVLIASTTITISYKESTDKITLKAEGIDRFGAFTISSYTLCGDFPCFGVEWSPSNSDNDMTKGDNGTWTKTYENVSLEAKKYQYKVAANHNWGQGEFPTSNVNNEYEIKEAGLYNLTFSYNPSKPELSCNATLVGASQTTQYPANITIYVTVHTQWTADNARFAAYFFGNNGDSWANMTLVENNIYATVVPTGEWSGMIICRMNPATPENTWDNLWGAQTQDIKYEEGKNHYIINSDDQTWDGNKPGGHWSTYGDIPGGNDNPGGDDNNNPEKPQPEASIYTLCGDSILFGSEWNETDTNNDMTKGEDGIWTKEYTEVTLTKGSYEYKVVADHNWETPGKYPSDETNMTLYIAKDGKYNITFTFDPTIPELKVVSTKIEEDPVNIDNIAINNIYVHNRTIYAEADITIYSITGQNVTNLNGNLKNGVYIVKSTNTTTKVVVK